ncbi:MAG: LuxR C-terminal-related transcriptional regulator [Tannerella sp.]|jgi:DNA-binding CsgD family transcriptional regulator|nr:LuxR C-terminal-related transcriptional regulator [Tannerella sp.]
MISQSDKDRLWEKHKPYIETLARVNNSSIFVSELHDSYWYISPNFKEYFGYEPGAGDVESEGHIIESLIHPDDIVVLLNLQERVFDYIFELPVEERADYKHIFEFRVVGADKAYKRIILQYHILEQAISRDFILLLGILDISPDQNLDDPVKFRLVNFKTGKVVMIPVVEETDVSLTKREVEILKLVNEGMLSKEISDKLSISIHTVNRHRQNILEKMEVDNVMEALSYSRRLGLIS